MGDADNTQIIMSVEEIEQWMDDALNEMDDGLSSLFSFMQVLNERTLRIVSEVATWQKFRRCFSALSMFVIPTVLAIGLSYGTIETANRYSNLQAALQSVITFLMYLSWSIGFPVYIYTLWEAYFSDFTTKHIFIHRTSSTDRDSELDDDSTRARCDDSSLILPFMEGSFERFSELGRLVSQRARNNIRSELERRANGAREQLAMAISHLFSKHFYDELFRHNIISCDGRIIANDHELKKYKEFLVRQAKDKTTKNHKQRKNQMDQVETLLKTSNKSMATNENLRKSLKKLGFKFTDDGMVAIEKFEEPPKRYLGPTCPKLTLYERQITAAELNKKVQKRDLKLLDNWLTHISDSRTRVQKMTPRTSMEWKEEEFKYRAKTEKVLKAMEKGRRYSVSKSPTNAQMRWVFAMNKMFENAKHGKETVETDEAQEKQAVSDSDDSRAKSNNFSPSRNMLDVDKTSKEHAKPKIDTESKQDTEFTHETKNNLIQSSEDDNGTESSRSDESNTGEESNEYHLTSINSQDSSDERMPASKQNEDPKRNEQKSSDDSVYKVTLDLDSKSVRYKAKGK